MRKKFHVDDRVPTELWTLFVAKAVKGASAKEKNVGNVSTQTEHGREEIKPAKKAKTNNTDCVKKLNYIQISQ